MSFSDLLNKPLPSKLMTESTNDTDVVEEVNNELNKLNNVTEETTEEVTAEADNTETNAEVTEEVNDTKTDDDISLDTDLEDIDLSGLSDAELDEMEDELRDSDLDDIVGDIEPVELSAEEEREADDLMCLAGTTELLKSELNADERQEFLESATDTQIAVFEGFLLESDVCPASDNEDDVITEAKMYNKTTIRFSREDRKAQLYAVALNVSARAHNDPDFVKLQRVQKMRRILKRKIQRKYHAEAVRRMKVYFNRLKSSKSNILAKLGQKIDGSVKKDK